MTRRIAPKPMRLATELFGEFVLWLHGNGFTSRGGKGDYQLIQLQHKDWNRTFWTALFSSDKDPSHFTVPGVMVWAAADFLRKTQWPKHLKAK